MIEIEAIAMIDNRTAKIVANATPDWVIWRLTEQARERVYDMRAVDESGRVYAVSYGMLHEEEQGRIVSGVNPHKHFAAIEALARATGRQLT